MSFLVNLFSRGGGGGSLFGKNETILKSFNEKVNSLILSSVSTFSSTNSSNVFQDQSGLIINASGHGVIDGVYLSQSANIDLSLLSDARVNANFQQDLNDKFDTLVKSESSNFPFGKDSTSITELKNIFKTSIDKNFNTNVMNIVQSDVIQKQNNIIFNAADNVVVKNFVLIQNTQIVQKASSSVQSDITDFFKQHTVVDTTTDVKNRDFLTDAINSLMEGISDIISSSTMIIIIIACILLFGAYYFVPTDTAYDIFTSIGSLVVDD